MVFATPEVKWMRTRTWLLLGGGALALGTVTDLWLRDRAALAKDAAALAMDAQTLASLKQRSTQLQAALQTAQQSAQSAQAQVTTLQSQLASAHQQVTTLTTQLQQAQAANHTLTGTVTADQATLQQDAAQLAALHAAVQTAQQQVATLTQQLQQAQSTAATAQSRVQALWASLGSLITVKITVSAPAAYAGQTITWAATIAPQPPGGGTLVWHAEPNGQGAVLGTGLTLAVQGSAGQSLQPSAVLVVQGQPLVTVNGPTATWYAPAITQSAQWPYDTQAIATWAGGYGLVIWINSFRIDVKGGNRFGIGVMAYQAPDPSAWLAWVLSTAHYYGTAAPPAGVTQLTGESTQVTWSAQNGTVQRDYGGYGGENQLLVIPASQAATATQAQALAAQQQPDVDWFGVVPPNTASIFCLSGACDVWYVYGSYKAGYGYYARTGSTPRTFSVPLGGFEGSLYAQNISQNAVATITVTWTAPNGLPLTVSGQVILPPE